MDPAAFAAKWKASTRTERAASQEHFNDLCHMLDVPTPNAADPTGDWYAFEKGASKTGGGEGFADVWKREHFGWEYKGKRKDLTAAYQQLLLYREALENPPLLVICDLDRFEVHTNFTGTKPVVYSFTLDDLANDPSEPLRILRAVMSDPDSLRPDTGPEQLTEEAAHHFAAIATSLRDRGNDPDRVAHFLTKLLFCMFAEDAGLLPKDLLTRLVTGAHKDPAAFSQGLRDLFATMSVGGGMFGADPIAWFNGGLFDGDDVIDMQVEELVQLGIVASLNWSQIEPAIFGTLFERGLDPDKRSQLGAHYTDKASIERLVEPVIVDPLRAEFEEMKATVNALVAKKKPGTTSKKPQRVWERFLDRLASVTVLDPACGSGNFLYIALRALKDLEREAIMWGAETLGETLPLPQVGPGAVRGIEVNHYAAELARVTIWIGQIQWMLENGFAYDRDPILRPLDAISARDAIVDLSDPDNPTEPEWPETDFIVGNPPFLGGKLLRANLGDAYVDAMFKIWDGRVPREADLVTYWFEKARKHIASGKVKRVGLLATQGIRGGANQRVLARVKETGDIFLAWSDEPWVLDGAAVHISFVGYDDGSEKGRWLDGVTVETINADLTTGHDLTQAVCLKENSGIAFMADTKGGPFDITQDVAMRMLAATNPDGRNNADVVRPWVNALDITRRPRDMWIIDFPPGTTEEEAALYEEPFEYVVEHVRPVRISNKRKAYAERWWMHVEPRPEMRKALAALPRYVVTPAVSKHRIFAWMSGTTLPDHALFAFARDDDYFFGIVHSRVHELWARGKGTQLREVESGFRYTPTSTFETFPFPLPTPEQKQEVADAAKNLNYLRSGWLANPEDTTRTLTSLYNKPPTWLQHAHQKVDAAVIAAYGWESDVADDEILRSLLGFNLQRAREEKAAAPNLLS
jgi:type II restriction/modification system DNA methylase subunit YeeA